jgi:hypothetical protein
VPDGVDRLVGGGSEAFFPRTRNCRNVEKVTYPWDTHYVPPMPWFREIPYRDCPWCGVKSVAMNVPWASGGVEAAGGPLRAWAVMTCPRCGGCVSVELNLPHGTRTPGMSIPSAALVHELQSVPESGHSRYQVDHLPEDVRRFFMDAIRVMDAGVPDAAAVQLRRTLEATAAHKDIRKKTLVQSVQEMIDQGLVTKDFGDVLTHVRKLGNLGAHYSDERLSEAEVQRALRFTTQFLRNVFEVPGELRGLQEQAAEDAGPEAQETAAVPRASGGELRGL